MEAQDLGKGVQEEVGPLQALLQRIFVEVVFTEMLVPGPTSAVPPRLAGEGRVWRDERQSPGS